MLPPVSCGEPYARLVVRDTTERSKWFLTGPNNSSRPAPENPNNRHAAAELAQLPSEPSRKQLVAFTCVALDDVEESAIDPRPRLLGLVKRRS